MKIVEVPAEAMQAVINYLMTKPYNEVAGLLSACVGPTGRLVAIDKPDIEPVVAGAPAAEPA